jgi:hypothetical protein
MNNNNNDDEDDSKKPAAKETQEDSSSPSSNGHDEKEVNTKMTTPGAVPTSSSQEERAVAKTKKNRDNRQRKQTAKMDVGVQLAAGCFEATKPNPSDGNTTETTAGAAPSSSSHDRAGLTTKTNKHNDRRRNQRAKLAPGCYEEQLSPPPPGIFPTSSEANGKGSGLQLASAFPLDDTFLDQEERATMIVHSEDTTTATTPTTADNIEQGERPDNDVERGTGDDFETPSDAFVVPERPIGVDRMAALQQLTENAPLAIVIQHNSHKEEAGNNEVGGRRGKMFRVRGAMLLVLLVVSVIVAAALTKWNHEEKEQEDSSVILSAYPSQLASEDPPLSAVPSMAPTTSAPTSDAFGIMASRLFANPEQDGPRDTTSPQWKAIVWLVEEDGFYFNTTEPALSMDHQLSRRYALATFYYSTTGEG